MKNKKNLYILLPAVFLVWSLVIYRFYTGLNPSVVAEEKQSITTTFQPKKLKETLTFSITADYRDPFLGTLTKKKNPVKRRAKPKKSEPEVPFPSVVYKGMVAPKGNSEKVFLVLVNGQQYYFKVKNTHNEVTLVKGNEKEITLQFEKRKQAFQIEK